MRRIVRCLVFLVLMAAAKSGNGQDQDVRNLFRIYTDNDLFNYNGKVTDKAYTAGLRFDLFFLKKRSSRSILDRLMPAAGKSCINIFQWGIMQVIYTPADISITSYQPYDYAYAGGLFAIHSLYSYNNKKKYDFQTELNAGVIGPISLAEESQKLVHHIIHYQIPMGWGNQLKNDLLLNINFAAEKQFASVEDFLELIAGSKVFFGTQMNAVSIYSLIRIGKMNPYFEGFIRQYTAGANSKSTVTNKTQVYFIIKPELQWVLTNAMLEGGMFSVHSDLEEGKRIKYKSYRDLQHIVYSLNCGAVLTSGHVSISLTQNASSMLIKETYNHEFGNLSFYFSW